MLFSSQLTKESHWSQQVTEKASVCSGKSLRIWPRRLSGVFIPRKTCQLYTMVQFRECTFKRNRDLLSNEHSELL